MKIDDDISRAAYEVVTGTRQAIFATADDQGAPHATWMTADVTPDLEEVVSITAPISRKVADLRRNPQAEWMFATPSMESLVYLSGPTRVLEGDAAKRHWDKMPGKLHAYYRKYCDIDDHTRFVVIRTSVEKVVFCKPYAYKKTVLFEKDQGGSTRRFDD